MLKLLLDSRHRGIVVIDRAPIAARSFGDWSMIAPVFTPTGKERLEAFTTDEIRPMHDFRSLLLEMVVEQSVEVTPQLPHA